MNPQTSIPAHSLIRAHPAFPLHHPWRPADLRERRLYPEVMDDPRLDPRDHEQALAGLARLNAFGGAHHHFTKILKQKLSLLVPKKQPIRVLEIACGDGQLLRHLQRSCNAMVRWHGVDISPTAIARARHLAPETVSVQVLDVLRDSLPEADLVLCSLFLHHLSESQLQELFKRLRSMSPATEFVLLDLERNWLAYWLVSAGARLLTRSPVVHMDSALSMRSAWTPSELEGMAVSAGLKDVRIERRFPCWLLLTGGGERF